MRFWGGNRDARTVYSRFVSTLARRDDGLWVFLTDSPTPASEADWQAAAPALAASRDDHGIKLAWTALDEWRLRGWPGYARVLQKAQVAA